MGKSSKTFRFSVGAENEPRSAVYRIWSGSADVYIAKRTMGDQFKVSLHERRGHIAVSEDIQEQVGLENRFLVTWPRMAKSADSIPDFRIILLTRELHKESDESEDTKGVRWILPAPPAGAVEVSLYIDKRENWPGQRDGKAELMPNSL